MNLGLDINTDNGRIYAEHQAVAAGIVFGRNTTVSFYRTDDRSPALVDGILVEDQSIVGVVEIKSRECEYAKFVREFNREWLITEQKLTDAAKVGGMLSVPAYGILYLIPSNICLVIRISNSMGEIVCSYRSEVTQTKATCNGGTANRKNAFVDMTHAKVYMKQL